MKKKKKKMKKPIQKKTKMRLILIVRKSPK